MDYPQDEHDAIVDRLRSHGWDRQDAENEADRIITYRIARREANKQR